MKKKSRCDFIDINNPEVKKRLLQNEGEFKGESISQNGNFFFKIRWKKDQFVFKCSVGFLQKGKSMRFDDEHECRHADVNLNGVRTKMFDGKFVMFKAECPLLWEILNSLPKDKAEVWKNKLFDEIGIGIQKREEYLKNPKIISDQEE